jgi:hypothetical protein
MKLKSVIFISFGLAVAATYGCVEDVDPGASAGSGSAGSMQKQSGGGGLPAPFTDADLSQQCEAGSALCYELCGSPSCAQQDNSIPSEVTTPGVLLPEGGTTDNACQQIIALSYSIRQRSCAMCHGPSPAPGFSGFNFVLDDHALVTQVPQTVTVPLIIPGAPSASVFMQRIALSLAGGQTGMPPSPSLASNLAGTTVANAIAYPTAEEVSILNAWIANCVPGTDGGAYWSEYYGGNYGPDASSPADAASSSVVTPSSDGASGVDASDGATSGVDASDGGRSGVDASDGGGSGVDASDGGAASVTDGSIDASRIRDAGGGRG